MLKSLRQPSAVPMIDLDTVRETLLYMKDDLRRDPALARAADALDTAIQEIDKAGPGADRVMRVVPRMARFLPRTP